MTTTPTSGAADLPEALRSIQRFEVVDCIDDKHVPAVIPKPHGPWVRYEDHIAALAAGQATAAQAVVQDDLITIRKPTTSAEMLLLLKLAHLVISDVDKTLEETFAPAQPAAEASRFGSPELQAMIIARCVEKDQADSVLYDPKAVLDVFNSARAGSEKPVGYMRGIRAVIAHWESRPEPHRWMVPAPEDSVQEDAALWRWLAEYLVGTRTDLDDEIVASETVNDLRKLVKAAIKQGEKSMTDKPTPTDAEIIMLDVEAGVSVRAGKGAVKLARAVLENCDSPVVARETATCQHEWDGLVRTSTPPKYACKKCHAFFDSSPTQTPQPTQTQAGAVPLDEARRLFGAGWKAAALFCDREDVVADGNIGFGACPQFEAAFSAAHGSKGGQHG